MKRVNKILSLVICLALCLGLLPTAALAEENTGDFSWAAEEAASVQTDSSAALEVVTDENIPAEAASVSDTVTADSTNDNETELPEETAVVGDGSNQSNDDLFAGYVDEAFLGSSAGNDEIMLCSTETARDQLSETDKNIYDALKPQIEKIASGENTSTELKVKFSALKKDDSVYTTYTASDLGVTEITSKNVLSLCVQILQFNVESILNALLADCSYELYWYSKTTGIRYTMTVGYDSTSLTLSSAGYLIVRFNVAAEYQDSTADPANYTTDNAITGAAANAAANAREIVAAAADFTDYSKLVYYRNQICALTSYNYSAISGSYGNPWQLIWVFDGDSTTNVVCEGYSKAFQYLCEMTSFDDSGIYSITVQGKMTYTSTGDHMWNIVHMPDGDGYGNFLVDVTNCDTGTVGYPDYLFLRGSFSGSVSDGYYIKPTASSSSAYYSYYNVNGITYTIGTYSESELTLTTTDYCKEELQHKWSDWSVDTSENFKTRTCSACHKTEICYFGDVNHDYSVNLQDMLLLKQALAGADVEIYTEGADISRDGSVNLNDLLRLIQQLVNG